MKNLFLAGSLLAIAFVVGALTITPNSAEGAAQPPDDGCIYDCPTVNWTHKYCEDNGWKISDEDPSLCV